MKVKIKTNEVSVDVNDIAKVLKTDLSNNDKLKVVKELCMYGDLIDMSFVEELVVCASKLRLKSIKHDKDLYNRNKKYFQALKTICSVKSAE